MKIEYRQSGGIANVMRGTTINVDSIPAKEAARWHTLVQASDLKSLAPIAKSSQARDAMVYTITIEDGADRYTRTFDDTVITPELDELVAELAERSAPVRP